MLRLNLVAVTIEVEFFTENLFYQFIAKLIVYFEIICIEKRNSNYRIETTLKREIGLVLR